MMKVFNTLEEVHNISPTVIALGNFDGVHLGHQALIAEAKKIAENDGLKTAVFSFSNHPKNLTSDKIVLNIAHCCLDQIILE